MRRGTPWSTAILRMAKLSFKWRVLLLGRLTTRSMWPFPISLEMQQTEMSEKMLLEVKTFRQAVMILKQNICFKGVSMFQCFMRHVWFKCSEKSNRTHWASLQVILWDFFCSSDIFLRDLKNKSCKTSKNHYWQFSRSAERCRVWVFSS